KYHAPEGSLRNSCTSLHQEPDEVSCVPCQHDPAGIGSAKDKLVVAVTSASTLNLRWRSATRTFPISHSCTSQTCGSSLLAGAPRLQSNGGGARLRLRSSVGERPPSYIGLKNQVTAYEGPKAALAAMRVPDLVPKASSSSLAPNSTTTPHGAATDNSAPSDNGSARNNSTSSAAPGSTTAADNDAAAASGVATTTHATPAVKDTAPLTATVSIDGSHGTGSTGGSKPARSANTANHRSNTSTTTAQLQVLPPVNDGSDPSAAPATAVKTTTATAPTPPIAMPIVTLSFNSPVSRGPTAASVTTNKAIGIAAAPRAATSPGLFKATDSEQRRVRGGA
ncbi:hypothetical protein Vretifemale_3728, partial [Volvox reticuliferus]